MIGCESEEASLMINKNCVLGNTLRYVSYYSSEELSGGNAYRLSKAGPAPTCDSRLQSFEWADIRIMRDICTCFAYSPFRHDL